MEFFLPCSRATSSEEQKCLKKSLWKKPTLKKTNKIHLLLLTHLLHLSTWKKNREEKNKKKLQQIYMKSPPEDLSDEHKMMKWYIIFTKKNSWKNDFTKKMRRRSHYWCQRPCERRRWKDMFKTCRICTTMKIHSEKAKFQSHSLAFQDKSKNFYYSTAIATLLLLYYLNYNYIILLLQYYELLKKSIFQSFCYCFSAPL